MTTPISSPFKLHFLPGVVSNDGLPAHIKRQFGWLPNKMKGGKMARKKQKRKSKRKPG